MWEASDDGEQRTKNSLAPHRHGRSLIQTQLSSKHQNHSMSQQDEESKKEDPNNVKADPFLASMTFASMSGRLRDCDCDECESVPIAIANAVQRHKRLKLMSMPLKRSQDRCLVKRHDKLSVWKWILPLHAEPVLESGNSHRLVFIERLPEGSVIKSIGKGIIGSSDEEKRRTVLNWNVNSVYLVPANGGKAVGWIHTTPESADNIRADPSGHIVIKVAKIPVEELKQDNGTHSNDEEPHWTDTVKAICRRALERDSTSEPINEKDVDLLKQCMH